LPFDRIHADPEPLSGFPRGQTLHLAQPDHIPASRRKRVEAGLGASQGVTRLKVPICGENIDITLEILEIGDQFERYHACPPCPINEEVAGNREKIRRGPLRQFVSSPVERKFIDFLSDVDHVVWQAPIEMDEAHQ
jgi:hypothetical protein